MTKKQNIKQKQYCNKFSKDFKNGPHQKKNLKKKYLLGTILSTIHINLFYSHANPMGLVQLLPLSTFEDGETERLSDLLKIPGGSSEPAI